MRARRILGVIALAVLSMATGCRTWCERAYPCPQACVPCCYPAASGYGAPAAVPPAPPPPTWGNPTGRPLNCSCTCQ